MVVILFLVTVLIIFSTEGLRTCISNRAGRISLRSSIDSSFIKAEDGLDIHVLRSKGGNKGSLLFIHGSYHSAYCWGDHFLPYFANDLGYDCIALSLRGTGPTGMLHGDKSKSIGIEKHVNDVKSVLGSLSQPVTVIAHSFGGLITMKLLEDYEARSKIQGVATLCSVPPSGNGPMTKRFLLRNFWSAIQITRGFVLKEVKTSSKICRELFFDGSIKEENIAKYMKRFEEDSKIGIDLGSLRGKLPSETSMSDSGRATYLTDDIKLRRLCIGAAKDFIVDREGVEETAKYFAVTPKFIDNAYHDCMLGPIWKHTAQTISWWLGDA